MATAGWMIAGAAGLAGHEQPSALLHPRPASQPRRIVAASVSSAEILLEIAPRERIVGVSVIATDPQWCLAADATAGLAVVGQSPEELLAVRPDLVITDPYTQRSTQELLEAVGVEVVRTREVAGFEDVAANIRLLGRVAWCDRAAEALVDQLEARLEALAAGAAEVDSWRVMNLNGSLDTYGRGSLFGAAVQAAGAINLPEQHGVGAYQPLDEETVLAWQPDALVVVATQPEARALPEWLTARPGLRLLPAIGRGHVLQLPAALLGSTSHHAVGVAERLQGSLRGWVR